MPKPQRSAPPIKILSIVALLIPLGMVRLVGDEPPIAAMAFSADCRWLITGSQRGLVVYGWPDLAESRRLSCELDSIHDLAVSQDGTRLFLGGGSPGVCGVVQKRRWPELDLEATWSDHDDVVYAIALSADGQAWSSASWSGDCQLYALDAAKVQDKVTEHSGPIFAAAYLSNRDLATAGEDRTIVITDTQSGKLLRVLKQHTKSVHALVQQPVGRNRQSPLLASASEDRTVRFWQAEIGRMVRFHRFESIPRAIAWANDGTFLVVGCDDGTVSRLDPITLAVTVLSKQKSRVQNLLVDSNDEQIVLSQGADLVIVKLQSKLNQ
jgi:WD40 repeat protein